MGAWGPGIFFDDIACDVRDDFRALIGDGLSPTEATSLLIADYQPDDDAELGDVFWLALAATQWRLGRLQSEVLRRALVVIDSGSNLRRWEDEADPWDAASRKKILERLRARLLSPQPPPRTVRKVFRQDTPFEVGDVIAYRLESGRQALLHVARLHVDRGGRAPIFQVLDWVGDNLPAALDFSTLAPRRPFLDPRFHPYTTRFVVFQRSKTDYPTTRLQLLAKNVVPAALPPLTTPGDSRDAIQAVTFWKGLDEALAKHFHLE
ncbi:MAG: hypothetical protein ACYC1C_08775 [Chloroflexota bacterium]